MPKSKTHSSKPKSTGAKPKRTMPKFGKPPVKLVSKFENALKDFPMTQRRMTFGAPAAMIGGKMFAGLHNDEFILRVGKADAANMTDAEPFEVMPGRIMTGWVVVPPRILNSPHELNAWMTKALTFTKTVAKK